MRLTKRVVTRVILLAVALSLGIWLLYEPGVEAAMSGTMRKAMMGMGDNVSATWQRTGAIIIDEDGDKWRCENPEASNPADMACALVDRQVQTDFPKLNPYVSVQNAQGQWLIFERKGDHEIIDANGTIWRCANRDGATTLANMGCTRSG